MATTYEAQVTMQYSDLTTRNVNFTDVQASALSNMKANIFAFNTAVADSVTGAAYKETFISDEGAPIVKINKAKYVATEEQVIYSD